MPDENDLHLYTLGERGTPDSWLISEWDAGQTGNMSWSADNVGREENGDVTLTLDRAPAGSARPYRGGEIQSSEVATTGTWSWTAQAPVMEPGAVFGMFTYKSDWEHGPWVEFDFEFVGEDTTKVQLAIHMENERGEHVVLNKDAEQRGIIDLGFDAAEGMHTYEVSVTEEDATFYVDGKEVAKFGAADMQDNVWQIGPVNSFVDLWSVSPGQASWAGEWDYSGTPLVGRIETADIRPGEFGSAFEAEVPEEVEEEPVIVAPEPEKPVVTPDPEDETPVPQPETPTVPEPQDPDPAPEDPSEPEQPEPEEPSEPAPPVVEEPQLPPVNPDAPPAEEDEEDPQDPESAAGGACFVATAAYGGRNHPHVAGLRRLRDEHLVKSAVGRSFVRTYWIVGPVIARHVRTDGISGRAVRAALAPICAFALRRTPG